MSRKEGKVRLLHTGDWHLGKKLERFSRLGEQKDFLRELEEVTHREDPDLVLIAGDIFDVFVPPTEAETLFYDTVRRLSDGGRRLILAIAGNHDSPDRFQAASNLARECGVVLAGNPHFSLPPFRLESGLELLGSEGGLFHFRLPDPSKPEVRILLTPYANEYRLRQSLGTEDTETRFREIMAEHWHNLGERLDDTTVNIMMTHLFMLPGGNESDTTGPGADHTEMDEGEDEKPTLYVGGAQAVFSGMIPPRIQYCALGHLHRKQTWTEANTTIVYPGSPLCYSLSEKEQTKFLSWCEIAPGDQAPEPKFIQINSGRPVYSRQFESVKAAREWLAQNQAALVDLAIESETYLTAKDLQALHNSHPAILGVRPVLTGQANPESNERDLGPDFMSRGAVDHFKDFFEFQQGAPPSGEILDLFREVLSLQGEQEV